MIMQERATDTEGQLSSKKKKVGLQSDCMISWSSYAHSFQTPGHTYINRFLNS